MRWAAGRVETDDPFLRRTRCGHVGHEDVLLVHSDSAVRDIVHRAPAGLGHVRQGAAVGIQLRQIRPECPVVDLHVAVSIGHNVADVISNGVGKAGPVFDQELSDQRPRLRVLADSIVVAAQLAADQDGTRANRTAVVVQHVDHVAGGLVSDGRSLDGHCLGAVNDNVVHSGDGKDRVRTVGGDGNGLLHLGFGGVVTHQSDIKRVPEIGIVAGECRPSCPATFLLSHGIRGDRQCEILVVENGNVRTSVLIAGRRSRDRRHLQAVGQCVVNGVDWESGEARIRGDGDGHGNLGLCLVAAGQVHDERLREIAVARDRTCGSVGALAFHHVPRVSSHRQFPRDIVVQNSQGSGGGDHTGFESKDARIGAERRYADNGSVGLFVQAVNEAGRGWIGHAQLNTVVEKRLIQRAVLVVSSQRRSAVGLPLVCNAAHDDLAIVLHRDRAGSGIVKPAQRRSDTLSAAKTRIVAAICQKSKDSDIVCHVSTRDLPIVRRHDDSAAIVHDKVFHVGRRAVQKR